MCHTVSFYRRSQGGDKGSIIIVITEAALFKLEVLSACIFFLSASSSEVCVLCFAVYSFRVFSIFCSNDMAVKDHCFYTIDLAVMHLLSTIRLTLLQCSSLN